MQLMLAHQDVDASQMPAPAVHFRLPKGLSVFDGNTAEAIAFVQSPVGSVLSNRCFEHPRNTLENARSIRKKIFLLSLGACV